MKLFWISKKATKNTSEKVSCRLPTLEDYLSDETIGMEDVLRRYKTTIPRLLLDPQDFQTEKDPDISLQNEQQALDEYFIEIMDRMEIFYDDLPQRDTDWKQSYQAPKKTSEKESPARNFISMIFHPFKTLQEKRRQGSHDGELNWDATVTGQDKEACQLSHVKFRNRLQTQKVETAQGSSQHAVDYRRLAFEYKWYKKYLIQADESMKRLYTYLDGRVPKVSVIRYLKAGQGYGLTVDDFRTTNVDAVAEGNYLNFPDALVKELVISCEPTHGNRNLQFHMVLEEDKEASAQRGSIDDGLRELLHKLTDERYGNSSRYYGTSFKHVDRLGVPVSAFDLIREYQWIREWTILRKLKVILKNSKKRAPTKIIKRISGQGANDYYAEMLQSEQFPDRTKAYGPTQIPVHRMLLAKMFRPPSLDIWLGRRRIIDRELFSKLRILSAEEQEEGAYKLSESELEDLQAIKEARGEKKRMIQKVKRRLLKERRCALRIRDNIKENHARIQQLLMERDPEGLLLKSEPEVVTAAPSLVFHSAETIISSEDTNLNSIEVDKNLISIYPPPSPSRTIETLDSIEINQIEDKPGKLLKPLETAEIVSSVNLRQNTCRALFPANSPPQCSQVRNYNAIDSNPERNFLRVIFVKYSKYFLSFASA